MRDEFHSLNARSDEPVTENRLGAVIDRGQHALTHSQFRTLDARVVGLWRATHFIFFAVLLFGSVIGIGVSWIESPGGGGLALAGWSVLAVFFGWITIWRPKRLYRAWSYRIDDRILETRSGLIVKVSRLLPLSRLQHVDLHRGPLERLFGLSSLVLHTAGTREATITIPGLDPADAATLRDHLIQIGGDDGV
ncbi:MAG TPA: PH domain-containing protein [Blastocatellia bacterium]|nr:PH domain-containing protein [Blastocatellia bacterium]